MHGQDEEGDFTIPIWIDVYEDDEGKVSSINIGCSVHYFKDDEDKELVQLFYDLMFLTFSSVRHVIGAPNAVDSESSMDYFLFFNGDKEFLTTDDGYEKCNDGKLDIPFQEYLCSSKKDTAIPVVDTGLEIA